jgi:dTDP-4-dehydrorhamnose 3,5-epimerase
MKRVETGIEGLVVLEPKVFGDERGFFMETFNAKLFQELGLPTEFVQDNFSRSARGVLRGLHFQRPPHAQAKLVRVTQGAVFDVAVDLRRNSKSFGQHYALELSAENKKAFYIPEGFAHGFCVLSEFADFQYKCTRFYSPADEGGLAWNDPELGIEWPVQTPTLSEKDRDYPSLKELRKQLSL